MVSAEFAPQKNEYTFAEILAITKDSLRAQINKEHLEKIFSYNVSNELMVVARAVPLFLKNLAMRLVYTQSALANTTTVTNIGNIKVEKVYEPIYPDRSFFFIFFKGAESQGDYHILSGHPSLYLYLGMAGYGDPAQSFPSDRAGWDRCKD